MKHLDMNTSFSHLMKARHPSDDLFHIAVAAKNCNTTSYNQSREEIRRSEKYIIHFETGISPNRIYFLEQEHGSTILTIDEPLDTDSFSVGTGDAMITNRPGSCLVIRTADCIPVMLYDPIQKCIAAVHSGWRSTEKNITGNTVQAMINRYACSPDSITAVILPGIKGESYEVSEDVALKFEGFFTKQGSSFFLSLQDAIINSLVSEGIQTNSIYASFYDTYLHDDLFFSHRRNETGRNLNFIYM